MMQDNKQNLWKRPNRKSSPKTIVLGFLEHLYDVAGDLINIPFEGRHLQPFRQDYSPSQLSNLICQCKRSGYIEEKEINQQRSIVLTNKARLKIIDKIVDSKKPDDKFRFISYDIPEDLRTARNKFRRVLKKLGFVQIQKSLWVCNKSVGALIEIAAYEYKVEKYIAYIVSERSDIDGLIKKKLSC